MVLSRAIPCLLIKNGGLVKTKKFKNANYIGDPINAIKIFNEKEVDELMIVDIDVSSKGTDINYELIEDIASECFMPVCYGGGVNSIDQMKKLYSLGIEKVSLSSSALNNPQLVTDAAKTFGSQSVVVTIDVKKNFWGNQKVFFHNGKKNSKVDVLDFVVEMENRGAGEIVINSIDRDGMMNGYDLDLLKEIKSSTTIPVIALGGAGSLSDLSTVVNEIGISAAAAGSLFVYHGPLNAVLINYPSYEELRNIFKN